MEQEVRSNDIFTMLANLMDSQSHGIQQSSQNNNNNSNPSAHMRHSPASGDINLLDNSQAQMDAAITQARNAHLMNITRQSASVTMSGTNATPSDVDIAEIERLSAYMHPNFSNSGSAPGSIENLYGSANQIGMASETTNVMDSRVPFNSNAGFFTNSQSQDAILDALSTIDASSASLPCQRGCRSDVTSFAQSYVSLLQQQSVDGVGGNFWPMNPAIVTGSSVGSSGTKQVATSSMILPSHSLHSNSHNLQSSSALSTDKLPSHLLQSANLSKVTPSLQHASRTTLANKGGRTNQQYSHNPSSQFGSRSIGSKNINDLVLPINNNGCLIECEEEIEDRSQEKKLTRTPIPSDADNKSSCSSASSGSVSGPEQSPDHNTERPSGRIDLHNKLPPRSLDNPSTRPSEGRENHSVLNAGNSKNYPCYGNMNVLNFGTINFSPVMDNSLPMSGDKKGYGNVPVPTSDNIVEIDASPRENTSTSAISQAAELSTGNTMRSAYLKGGTYSVNSYAQMQTVTPSQPHAQATKKSKTKNIDAFRNFGSGDHHSTLNENFLQSSSNAVSPDQARTKQKKSRNSKHKHAQQIVSQGKTGLSAQYNSFMFTGNGQPSNLKPKVNADPTKKLNIIDNSINKHNGVYPNCLVVPNQQRIVAPGTQSAVLDPQSNYQSNMGGMGQATPPRSHVSNPGQPRHWQTVTAVQGPKLPPMLSEQDRIPKRGRPSKKMMQQNLKIKKDAAVKSAANPPTLVPPPKIPEPRVPQTTQPSPPNLVSMYTINDKGFMEEIAPKAKENRRSKERTEAFLKYLDDIKIASKHQMATNPKFGEKAKTGTDKQTKRKPRPRTKVFGRVSQPLTKEGITETMCTFSALAHQYKISSSIVERATENFLKSAGKRNREHYASGAGQRLTEKNTKVQHTDFNKNNMKKGVQFVTSHCETLPTVSSETFTVPTIKSSEESFRKVEVKSTVPVLACDPLPQFKIIENTPTSSTPILKESIDTSAQLERVQNLELPNVDETIVDNNIGNVIDSETVSELTVETLPLSAKGKHKKKKHKKHKKHKHQELTSGKKKKKDKDRKKKSRKKLKTKLGHSVIPSSSVSLVKPPTKPVLDLSEPNKLESDNDKAKIQDKSSYLLTQNKSETFSPIFRQCTNTDIDHSNPWQQEDNYDVEDSSSDEMSTSPKSYIEPTAETQATSATTNTLSSFAQYSNSRIGFGTFSADNLVNNSPKISIDCKSTAAVLSSNSHDQADLFSSQGAGRPVKKHTKHKKKKFFRKSKNNFDPAFMLILDELLVNIKNLSIDPTGKQKKNSLSHRNTNIFFSANISDIPQTSLWRSSTSLSSTTKNKAASATGNKKRAVFPKGPANSSRSGALLNKIFSTQESESGDSVDSLSVFCSSFFFQKHGYVAKLNSPAHPPKENCSNAQAHVKSNTIKTHPPPTKPNLKNQLIQGEAKSSEELPFEGEPELKRKRGWPRGKPRGTKAKRGRPSKLHPMENDNVTQVVTQNSVNQTTSKSNIDGDLKNAFGTSEKKKKKTDGLKAGSNNHVTTSPSVSNSLESDLSNKLGGESLMLQIRQAIEANLPESANKDAITKSVDAAVLNYLESMTKTKQEVGTKDNMSGSGKLGKRHTRSISLEDSDKLKQSSNEGTSTRLNVEKHPKKVWAYKHQDTTCDPLLVNNVTDSSLPSAAPKKRGPGRPRKNPISSTLAAPTSVSQDLVHQGKVPTSSATVVPAKRKDAAVRMQSKCMRPAVKRLLARARNDFAHKNSIVSPRSGRKKLSKEDAILSVSTLSSVKSLKMKGKDVQSVSEPGMYATTVVEDHITEALDATVDMYTWDNYKAFEEACRAVENEMGFSDELDAWIGDNKPKISIVKKSIESVVEKLKNKQALNLNTAATTLLELSNSCENTLMAENVDQCLNLSKGHKNILNKVSSFQRNSVLNNKAYKVKKARSNTNGSVLKRPRGRPRKNLNPEEPISKKPKTMNHDKQFLPKSSSVKGDKKQRDISGNKEHKKHNSSETDLSLENVNPVLSPCKPYLEAGLYSSTFKRNYKSSNHTSRNHSGDVTNLPVKLPPPFDAGLYLRNTLKDFQLPFDIWWMYKHKKISVSQDPSTNFVKIDKNVYTSLRPALNLGDHICNCNTNDDCGKECLNRLMYFECLPSTCPCSSRCTNQVIQKAEWCKSLERFKTIDRGWGVRTSQRIHEGSFILEYVGEVLSEAEFRIRTIELYHAYNDHYCVQLDSSTVIDGYRMANEGRFVNHSCEPNCEMQKWCVDGEHRIGLFALRQIHSDEELTYDYNFHAFDVDAQQSCRCGSHRCRNVIGGRSQQSIVTESDLSVSSSNFINIKPSKSINGKLSKVQSQKSKDDELGTKEFSILQMKPISKHDKDIIRERQLFLLRNLTQVRKKEEEQNKGGGKKGGAARKSGYKNKSKKSHQSKEESEKLDAAITEMYTAIATCKDQNGVSVAIPFMNLPSKKKNPEYYERISSPIDLSMIERNIVSNHYKDIETFNSDVQRVFKNAEKYHGRKSTLGKDVIRLRKAYVNARGAAMLVLNGHKKTSKSAEVSEDDDGEDEEEVEEEEEEEDMDGSNENIHRKNEDHIRCICGIFKDEGLMVQCEKCFVWQHCDCMGIKPGNTDRYLCEECDQRPYAKEVTVIPPPANTPTGHTYYVTLLSNEMLVKQGDCAYLMRDHRLRRDSLSALSMRASNASNRNLANISQDKLDIFRVEQLWTDERGDKYAYGHHFLRPHETHHSPSRTFYRNELFASPFNEIIPLAAVVGLCCVMDLYTYCKGKPKDFKIADIYICDFRIDKAAGLFTRINKKRYPICTKPHVFDAYKNKLCPKKNFQPHQVPEQYKKSGGRSSANSDLLDPDVVEISSSQYSEFERNEDGSRSDTFSRSEVGSAKWKKRQRLNGIAHRLLGKLPKQAVDVSYLLEPGSGKRQRKKTQLSLESLSQEK